MKLSTLILSSSSSLLHLRGISNNKRWFSSTINYENYLSNDKIKKLMQKMKYDKKVSDNYINIICIDNKGGFIKKLSFEKLEKILTKII